MPNLEQIIYQRDEHILTFIFLQGVPASAQTSGVLPERRSYYGQPCFSIHRTDSQFEQFLMLHHKESLQKMETRTYEADDICYMVFFNLMNYKYVLGI